MFHDTYGLLFSKSSRQTVSYKHQIYDFTVLDLLYTDLACHYRGKEEPST